MSSARRPRTAATSTRCADRAWCRAGDGEPGVLDALLEHAAAVDAAFGRDCSRPTPRRIALRSTDARSRAGTRGAARISLLRAAPPERGWSAGTVELEPDELRGDDVRYFAVWIGRAPARPRCHARGFLRAQRGRRAACRADARRRRKRDRVGPRTQAHGCPRCSSRRSDPCKLGAANRALERLGVRGASVRRARRAVARARTARERSTA